MVRILSTIALALIAQSLFAQSYFEDFRSVRTFFGDVIEHKPVRSSVARVIMFSRDNCPPCDRWYANDKHVWESQGWIVQRVKYNGPLATPWFAVLEPRHARIVRSRLTYSSYLSSPTRVRMSARWTYSGTIRAHLRNNHSVIVDGISDEDAELLHDLLHETE